MNTSPSPMLREVQEILVTLDLAHKAPTSDPMSKSFADPWQSARDRVVSIVFLIVGIVTRSSKKSHHKNIVNGGTMLTGGTLEQADAC